MKLQNNIRHVFCVLLLIGLSDARALADDFTNLIAKGYWALQQHNFPIALAYYENALNLETNNASAYSGRGAIYLQMKMYQQAEADFTKAIGYSTNAITLANAYYCRG